MNMAINIVHAPADQSMIGRRPIRSIVDGVNQVPMAKTVFITAASSWDKKGETPTCVNMMVL